GVAAAQDDTAPGPGTDDGADAGAALPPIPPVTLAPQQNPITDPDVGQVPQGLDASGFTTDVPDQGIQWIAVLVVVALLALGVLAPAIVRRWRRAHPPSDVSKQMSNLWRRALGAVEATGCRIDPTLTPLEQARAVSP